MTAQEREHENFLRDREAHARRRFWKATRRLLWFTIVCALLSGVSLPVRSVNGWFLAWNQWTLGVGHTHGRMSMGWWRDGESVNHPRVKIVVCPPLQPPAFVIGVALAVLSLVQWEALTRCVIARRRAERQRGLCRVCGYDLVGLDEAGRCPECGTSRIGPGTSAGPV
jgi:hypothetical protein